MEIEVRVAATVGDFVKEVPRLDGPGKLRYFSDSLVLERVDNRTPGNGLPQAEEDRRAGTHSGFLTTIRIVDATDAYLPGGGVLFQYEGTYRLDAVPAGPSPALP